MFTTIHATENLFIKQHQESNLTYYETLLVNARENNSLPQQL